MKSIKKRFKTLLADIEQSASELLLLSTDISLLQEMQELAHAIIGACKDLRRRASDLNKAEFVKSIKDAQALAKLEEIVDLDVISAIEQRFFAASPNPDESDRGELFQQLLTKLERHYAAMVEKIQQLSSLLDETTTDQ